jgi:hypothetical protein
MPRQWQIGGGRDLLQTLLNLVFAKVDLAGGGGGAYGVGRKRFGNRDETNGGGVAPHPARGARDALADVVEPGAKERKFQRYFFN